MPAALPSTEKGRRTRERIVRAAAELVAERGAANVSLDDVGAHAPASRSQLYHYFEDRDDLLRAVVDSISDTVIGGQAEYFEHLGTWAGIERWMDALVAIQVRREACGGCPLGSLAGQFAESDPKARAAIATGLDRWAAQIEIGLASLKANGELREEADPARLAQATLAFIQGGLLLTQVHRDPHELRAALDAALTLLRSQAPPKRSASRSSLHG